MNSSSGISNHVCDRLHAGGVDCTKGGPFSPDMIWGSLACRWLHGGLLLALVLRRSNRKIISIRIGAIFSTPFTGLSQQGGYLGRYAHRLVFVTTGHAGPFPHFHF